MEADRSALIALITIRLWRRFFVFYFGGEPKFDETLGALGSRFFAFSPATNGRYRLRSMLLGCFFLKTTKTTKTTKKNKQNTRVFLRWLDGRPAGDKSRDRQPWRAPFKGVRLADLPANNDRLNVNQRTHQCRNSAVRQTPVVRNP